MFKVSIVDKEVTMMSLSPCFDLQGYAPVNICLSSQKPPQQLGYRIFYNMKLNIRKELIMFMHISWFMHRVYTLIFINIA